MPRFIMNDDLDDCIDTINEKNGSSLSLDTSEILDVSPHSGWLKEACKKKGLKLSGSNISTSVHSPTLNHINQSNKSKPSIINTDFEWPKISAIEKYMKIKIEDKGEPIIENISTVLNSTTLSESSAEDSNKSDPSNYKDAENNSNPTNHNIKRSGIVFSTKKLLLENELLRQENVKKEMVRRKEDMENFSQNLKYQKAISLAILAQKRKEEELEKNRCMKAEEDMINEKIKQSEMRRKHEQQLHKQRIKEQMEKLEQEQDEYIKTMKEKEELIEKILPFTNNFQDKCENINILLTSCKDRNAAIMALTPHYNKIQELEMQMNIIKGKTQMGTISVSDVQITEDILRSLDDVIHQYSAETERIDSVFDAEIARREYECKQAELQLQAASQHNYTNLQPELTSADKVDSSKQAVTKTASPSTEHLQEPQIVTETAVVPTAEEATDWQSQVKPELWNVYNVSRTYLEQFQDSHKEFLQSESLKKFRFDCQKAINTPINAINAISREHLVDKYIRVINFLTGKLAPNVASHPQGISFSIHTLAKKIVTQGETLVSSKPEMGFSIASFAVAIWNEYPQFGEMLVAHFSVSCPYTIPIWLPQADANATDYNNLKKYSGMLRLYASILVSRTRQGVTKSHPHGLGNAWKWLAATLNTEPRADTTEIMATLIFDMLEVVGHFMLSAYPKQFLKMLTLLQRDFFPKLKLAAKDAGGPVTRLDEFLQKSMRSGSIPPPAGILPPNYW